MTRSVTTATHRGILEVGVRPNSIRLVPPVAEARSPARVEQAAYLGTNVSYLVRTPGGTA